MSPGAGVPTTFPYFMNAIGPMSPTLAAGQGALISATRWDLRRAEDMRIGARQSQLLQPG
jgi:hypothetical protein